MSTTHLPEAIVAASTALAVAVSRLSTSHPDCTLATLESGVLAAMRQALPSLLQAALLATQRQLASVPVRCPHCGHAALVQAWRSRQLQTLCGTLRWERPWACCPACGVSFGAGDASLGVAAADRRSSGMTALLVALGGTTAFREAAALLEQTTGLVVSSETVRRVTEAAGGACAEQQDATTAAYTAGKEPPPADTVAGVLVAETDGVMVRYLDGWHEVKVGLVGGWDEGRGRLQQPSYVAAREESGAFAQRFGAEAARRGALTVVGWHGAHAGVAALRPVVVLGDGARWIWEAAAAQFGERTEIIDYFHACEHLTAAAAALHGAGTAAATAWAAARRTELLAQGIEAVLPQLVAHTELSPAAQATLRTERGYFTTNQARMQYPRFRAAGLPIGSGAVESSAKHVVQQRLKRPGARWSDRGGRALLALRAQQASDNGKAA